MQYALRICRSSTGSHNHHGFDTRIRVANYNVQLRQINGKDLSGIDEKQAPASAVNERARELIQGPAKQQASGDECASANLLNLNVHLHDTGTIYQNDLNTY